MRMPNLLAVLFWIAMAGPALAGPLEDAAAAYGRGDYATAFGLWLPLAEQGSAQAQLNLGRMYENGEGVSQNRDAAMEWYRKAAEQRVGDAQAGRAAMDASNAATPATVTVLRGSSAPPEPRTAQPALELAPTAPAYDDMTDTPFYFLPAPFRGWQYRMPARLTRPSRAESAPARR
jgi:TPR repeat protein